MADLPSGLEDPGDPCVQEPEDFRRFWEQTLAEARTHELAVRRSPVQVPLEAVQVWDLSFAGFGGHRVRAWLTLPADRHPGRRLPAVVQVPGYGRGRGLAGEQVHVAAAGVVHLLMDVRGQGLMYGTGGDTPDLGCDGAPETPGVLTRGIGDPRTYYYRRLITDAVRAVEAVRTLPEADPARVVAMGNSQGGGVALGVAGLVPDLAGLTVSVPFLCDVPAVYRCAQGSPYDELATYLAVRRDGRQEALHTLSYVDGVNHARYATAPSLWALGLRDITCPSIGGQRALVAYGGPAQVCLYPDNGHEGGEFHFLRQQLQWLRLLAGSED